MKNYYVVKDGEVEEVNLCEGINLKKIGVDIDDKDWVVVYAAGTAEALEIADAYDREEVGYTNIWCQACGHAHGAVTLDWPR